jgi:hypothetical protein
MEGNPLKLLKSSMFMCILLPECHLIRTLNSSFTADVNSLRIKPAVDFPIANFSETSSIVQPWTNLYRATQTRASMGTDSLYLVHILAIRLYSLRHKPNTVYFVTLKYSSHRSLVYSYIMNSENHAVDLGLTQYINASGIPQTQRGILRI